MSAPIRPYEDHLHTPVMSCANPCPWTISCPYSVAYRAGARGSAERGWRTCRWVIAARPTIRQLRIGA